MKVGIPKEIYPHELRVAATPDTVDKMKMRVLYDLEYLRNWSLLLDLQIVLKTALVVLKRSNAY